MTIDQAIRLLREQVAQVESNAPNRYAVDDWADGYIEGIETALRLLDKVRLPD